MSESKEKSNMMDKRLSRRIFIKNSGLTVGGVVLGGALGSLFGTSEAETPTGANANANQHKEALNPNIALMHFTPEQFKIVEAATERIFPVDENGPGAKDLLVAYFIDHQLASGWGYGAKEYTSGPFFPGEPSQGYQSSMNRQQLFEVGIAGLESHSLKNYKKPFIELSEEEQDAVLTDASDDKVKLKGISSKTFFSTLRSATIEGVYADPLYGGNANMEGWKMKNFPGHQMSYMNIIEKDEFVKIEPVALNSQHNH